MNQSVPNGSTKDCRYIRRATLSRAALREKCPGALKANWIVTQAHRNRAKWTTLLVEIGPPVAIDHARQEQPGDQKEIGMRNGFANSTT
jgi:hypothetical protein